GRLARDGGASDGAAVHADLGAFGPGAEADGDGDREGLEGGGEGFFGAQEGGCLGGIAAEAGGDFLFALGGLPGEAQLAGGAAVGALVDDDVGPGRLRRDGDGDFDAVIGEGQEGEFDVGGFELLPGAGGEVDGGGDDAHDDGTDEPVADAALELDGGVLVAGAAEGDLVVVLGEVE